LLEPKGFPTGGAVCARSVDKLLEQRWVRDPSRSLPPAKDLVSGRSELVDPEKDELCVRHLPTAVTLSLDNCFGDYALERLEPSHRRCKRVGNLGEVCSVGVQYVRFSLMSRASCPSTQGHIVSHRLRFKSDRIARVKAVGDAETGRDVCAMAGFVLTGVEGLMRSLTVTGTTPDIGAAVGTALVSLDFAVTALAFAVTALGFADCTTPARVTFADVCGCGPGARWTWRV
jgi:hypothetical protein